MRHWLFLGFLVAACGAKQPPPESHVVDNAQAAPDAAPPPPRSDLGCVLDPADQVDTCPQRGEGCQLGPAPYCSGVAPPEGWEEERAQQPCVCVCPADIERCAEVP